MPTIAVKENVYNHRMKRRIALFGGLILILIVTWLITSRKPANPGSDTEASVPTQTLQVVQDPDASELVDESENSVEDKKPEPTTEVSKITCDSKKPGLQSLAKEFYSAHQKKDVDNVMGLISTPYTQEEQDQLDYWLGIDNNFTPRLYQTPESSYSVTSYTLGKIADRGQDQDERGSKRCQMSITEVRAITSTVPYTEETVTRFLDFAIDPSGYATLTAYRKGKDGEKYSGLGN